MDSKLTLQRILILDDDSDYRKLLLTWLGSQFPGVKIVEYDPQSQGIPGQGFDWAAVDVLLLDYNLQLKNATGLDILQANYNNDRFPPTIMLTGAGSEDVAVRAFKYEVTDYLRKEWLDKGQLMTAVENAFHHKILKIQQLNILGEARQIARAESEMMIMDFKSKFSHVRELEHKRLQLKQHKINKELQNNQALLAKIEQERARAEKTKRELLAEVERLKDLLLVATDSSSVNIKLESTHQRLEASRAGIDIIEQNYEQAKAAVDKALWKQDQSIELQQQLAADLNIFKEDIDQQKKLMSEISTKIEMELSEKKNVVKKRKINEQQKEQKLIKDVSSQLKKE